MHRRLLMRCALASAGAFAVFTAALATPAPCRFSVHARPDPVCVAERSAPVVQAPDGRARLMSLSIAGSRGTCLAARDSRCWSSALVRACVTGAVL